MVRSVPQTGSRSVGLGVTIAASLIAVAVSIVLLAPHRSPATPPVAGFPPSQAVPVSVARLGSIAGGGAVGWRLPVSFAGPRDVAVSADGTVWITEQNKGAVDALSDGRLIRYQVDAKFPNSGAFGLSPGPSGSVWFTGYPNGNIGRVLPDGTVNSFTAVVDASGTIAASEAPDGAMWFTDVNLGIVMRIDAGGDRTAFQVAPPPGTSGPVGPYDITGTPNGTIWFTDPRTRAVGAIQGADGSPAIAEHEIRDGSIPRSISAGPDGTVWITLPKAHSIGRVDASGTVHPVPIDTASPPMDLAVAGDGTIWLTTAGSDILHVRPDGSLIRRVVMPGGAVGADGIAVAPDGTVWAAATDADMVVELPSRPRG
jgi:virginiamycin B lyase